MASPSSSDALESILLSDETLLHTLNAIGGGGNIGAPGGRQDLFLAVTDLSCIMVSMIDDEIAATRYFHDEIIGLEEIFPLHIKLRTLRRAVHIRLSEEYDKAYFSQQLLPTLKKTIEGVSGSNPFFLMRKWKAKGFFDPSALLKGGAVAAVIGGGVWGANLYWERQQSGGPEQTAQTADETVPGGHAPPNSGADHQGGGPTPTTTAPTPGAGQPPGSMGGAVLGAIAGEVIGQIGPEAMAGMAQAMITAAMQNTDGAANPESGAPAVSLGRMVQNLPAQTGPLDVSQFGAVQTDPSENQLAAALQTTYAAPGRSAQLQGQLSAVGLGNLTIPPGSGARATAGPAAPSPTPPAPSTTHAAGPPSGAWADAPLNRRPPGAERRPTPNQVVDPTIPGRATPAALAAQQATSAPRPVQTASLHPSALEAMDPGGTTPRAAIRQRDGAEPSPDLPEGSGSQDVSSPATGATEPNQRRTTGPESEEADNPPSAVDENANPPNGAPGSETSQGGDGPSPQPTPSWDHPPLARTAQTAEATSETIAIIPLDAYRAQNPGLYENLSDRQLAEGLYARFYAHLPRGQFFQALGLDSEASQDEMPSLRDYRARYPGLYDDMTDVELAQALHARFFSQLPEAAFERKIGLMDPDDPQVVRELEAGLTAGRELFANQDYDRAYRVFLDLAQRGSTEAQFSLGYLFANGLGAPAADDRAALWYRKAAQSGHMAAQYNLGVLLSSEDRDAPGDDAEAAHWTQKAAQQGDPDAQFNLAQLYRIGRGVPRDPVQALKWFQIASLTGDAAAAQNRDALAASLEAEQIAEAQRLAREWREAQAR